MNLRRHTRKPVVSKVSSPRVMSREAYRAYQARLAEEARIRQEINHRRALATREGLIAAGLLKPNS